MDIQNKNLITLRGFEINLLKPKKEGGYKIKITDLNFKEKRKKIIDFNYKEEYYETARSYLNKIGIKIKYLVVGENKIILLTNDFKKELK